MKLTDQEIIASARRQRDADNQQLTVRPWAHGNRRRFRVPAWLVAIPAAAVAGFFLGLAVQQPQPDTSLALQRDTVYVERQMLVAQTPDTIIKYVERSHRAGKPSPTAQTGRSIDQDDIDYSMLVRK
ncbi:MAG: hypothetical protein IJ612_01565 [Prevotella sp.]|nr:hypothetical protein [Prevotella sp.]